MDLICTEFFKYIMKKIAFIFTIAVIGILFVTCESSTYVEVSGDVSHPTYETKIKPRIRSQG